eukprot:8435820-Pyramimonas_sp.AAC.1
MVPRCAWVYGSLTHVCPPLLRAQPFGSSLMPMSWTKRNAGMRPPTPEVMMLSSADRHTGMSSRIKLLSLVNINTSASARMPD